MRHRTSPISLLFCPRGQTCTERLGGRSAHTEESRSSVPCAPYIASNFCIVSDDDKFLFVVGVAVSPTLCWAALPAWGHHPVPEHTRFRSSLCQLAASIVSSLLSLHISQTLRPAVTCCRELLFSCKVHERTNPPLPPGSV